MIDDITNFRQRLREIAVMFVANFVQVQDFKEWAQEQEWYKIGYFKTKLEKILFGDISEYTKEEWDLINLNVDDVMSGFVTSAKKLNKTMALFLGFTAKAADIKLLTALLGSASQLAEASEASSEANHLLSSADLF